MNLSYWHSGAESDTKQENNSTTSEREREKKREPPTRFSKHRKSSTPNGREREDIEIFVFFWVQSWDGDYLETYITVNSFKRFLIYLFIFVIPDIYLLLWRFFYLYSVFVRNKLNVWNWLKSRFFWPYEILLVKFSGWWDFL